VEDATRQMKNKAMNKYGLEREEDNLYQEVKAPKKSNPNTSKAKTGQASRGMGMQKQRSEGGLHQAPLPSQSAIKDKTLKNIQNNLIKDMTKSKCKFFLF